jgi:hypothetical protein
MREADRWERLENLCHGMLYGSGKVPGLLQLVADLESQEHVPEMVLGILIRFGRLRILMQMLTGKSTSIRPMRKSMVSLSERLGALLERNRREIRYALQDEARRTAKRLNAQLARERSGRPAPRRWFPLKSPRRFDQFVRELDSARYLRSALRYLDFEANISPWVDFANENSRKIAFLVREAQMRGQTDMGFYPDDFWWRTTKGPELAVEPAKAFVKTFKGSAIWEWLGIIVVIGLGLLWLTAHLVSARVPVPAGLCTLTFMVIVGVVIGLFVLLRKVVTVSDRRIEYRLGKLKRFEAKWRDVQSVRIWRKKKPSSAYSRYTWGIHEHDWDYDWDFDRDGKLNGLDIGNVMLDVLQALPRERIESKGVYGILVRTRDDKFQLKSGFDFSQYTIQKIFESVARAIAAYPHVKVKDTRIVKTKMQPLDNHRWEGEMDEETVVYEDSGPGWSVKRKVIRKRKRL